MAKAREMLDKGAKLDEIAVGLKISDITVRKYLRGSFAAEGQSMSDLRRRRGRLSR